MSGAWAWVPPGDPSGSVPSARKFHAAVASTVGMMVAHLQCSGIWESAVRSNTFCVKTYGEEMRKCKHPFDVHRLS